MRKVINTPSWRTLAVSTASVKEEEANAKYLIKHGLKAVVIWTNDPTIQRQQTSISNRNISLIQQ